MGDFNYDACGKINGTKKKLITVKIIFSEGVYKGEYEGEVK